MAAILSEPQRIEIKILCFLVFCADKIALKLTY